MLNRKTKNLSTSLRSKGGGKMAVFGVIVSTRGFFPGWLAEEAREQIAKKLEAMGHGCVMVDSGAMPYGAVETYEQAKVCAALFRKERDRMDGILVILPNFGDEIGVASALHEAGLNVPVLIQACDDKPELLDVAHRRDAFCGKLSVCNNLRQYGIPYSLTSLHTCAIDSASFTGDIQRFEKLCRVVNRLRKAKILAVGTRPQPFRTVRFSEKLLQKYGITVIVEDMGKIIADAREFQDENEIKGKISDIGSYVCTMQNTPPEKLGKLARFGLALEKAVERHGADAGAVQCWDVLQNQFGCAACLAMSMLGEKGVPQACEMDVTGALTMLALSLAAGSPAGYLDWNNNYGEDRDMCINFHCSNYPASFIGVKPALGVLDILGTQLGLDNCHGACAAQVRPGPMTFCKITTDDANGRIRAYVGEGEFAGEEVKTFGGPAACRIPNLQKLMRMLCEEGFEHHVSMVRGHVADVIEEAFSKYLGWEVIRHS
jgi:L-fucose isomerase-like protein